MSLQKEASARSPEVPPKYSGVKLSYDILRFHLSTHEEALSREVSVEERERLASVTEMRTLNLINSLKRADRYSVRDSVDIRSAQAGQAYVFQEGNDGSYSMFTARLRKYGTFRKKMEPDFRTLQPMDGWSSSPGIVRAVAEELLAWLPKDARKAIIDQPQG